MLSQEGTRFRSFQAAPCPQPGSGWLFLDEEASAEVFSGSMLAAPCLEGEALCAWQLGRWQERTSSALRGGGWWPYLGIISPPAGHLLHGVSL